MSNKENKGIYRNSGGTPVEGIPEGAGKDGWDDRETLEDAPGTAKVIKEEDLCIHF